MRQIDCEKALEISDTGCWLTYQNYRGTKFFAPIDFDLQSGKMRGGAFLCLPYFGIPPESMNSGNADLPQHGKFRTLDCKLRRCMPGIFEEGNEGIICLFNFGLGELMDYRLYVEGHVGFYPIGNRLLVDVLLEKEYKNSPKTPINPGWHPFFRNSDGIIVTMGDFQKAIIGTITKAESILYTGPLTLDIKRIGRVVMNLKSNCMKAAPRVVFWGDRPDRTCVELVLDNPEKLDTPEGIFLDSEFRRLSMKIEMSFFPY